MRVLFSGGGTGGHLYPALAIARALVRLQPSVRPLFVGAERGIERQILPATEFEHRLLPIHPLYRARPWNNWRTVTGAARAWRQLARLTRQDRPLLVVGTGGYASAAALVHARLSGVAYVLQEQNGQPGMVTRLFAGGAREIYLGYERAAHRMHSGKRTTVIWTGNPIDPPPVTTQDRRQARLRWGFQDADCLLVLVFGGSQGAKALNEAVAEWVKGGIAYGLRIIWATGRSMHQQYAGLASDRVRVEPYLSPIAEAYAACDLAVSRAGALTLAELCAWGVPSIMVPLPTAAADHQTANALEVAESGAGILLRQRDLTAARLAEEVAAFASDRARLAAMADSARRRARPRAAEDIANRILKLIDVKHLPA